MTSEQLEQFRALLMAELPEEWTAAVEAGAAETLDELATGPFAQRAVDAVARNGWLTPEWPTRYGGRDLGAEEGLAIKRELYRWRVGSVRSAIGTTWVGPSILKFGSEELCSDLLPPIAANEAQWCQLFSEPEAGSDLAAIRTSAVRDGEDWIINGSKLWTSRADTARWGLAIVRTETSVPKHAGLTCFCIDMSSAGVSLWPIRQMSGDSEFFETHLDHVRVPDALRLGKLGQGWEITRTVLTLERRAGAGLGAAPPGSVAGRSIHDLIERFTGNLDPVTADRLTELYVDGQVIEANNRRMAAERKRGGSRAAESPFSKVIQSEYAKRLQQLAVDLDGFGSRCISPEHREWSEANVHALLRVQAKSIAGGTNDILRNQIGERTLGLPREVDPFKEVPWREQLGAGHERGNA